jgi:hypothetical protein
MTVLEHILACDVERASLLEEQTKIEETDETNMKKKEKQALSSRLAEIVN